MRLAKWMVAMALTSSVVACAQTDSGSGDVGQTAGVEDTAASEGSDTASSGDAQSPDAVAEPDAALDVVEGADALPDVAPPLDTSPAPDIADEPDTAAAPPAPGALGGECKAADACDEGACEAVAGGAQKVCTQPCLSNYDCPTTLRCEAISAEAQRCLAGPRGQAALGEPCGPLKGNGCLSGLCVDADPAADLPVDVCTEPCAADSECSFPFPVCFAFVDLCLPIPSGQLGGRCKSSGVCDEGECIDVAGTGERCTVSCTAAAECGAEYMTCRAVGADQWCLPKGAGE